MSGIFGGDKPKMPEPPPKVQHEAVQAAGDAQRIRTRKAHGSGATMLTKGLSDDAPVATKKLLGR